MLLNVHHFVENILKLIFLNISAWIIIRISLNCVSSGPIDDKSVLVLVMAWYWKGDKALPEKMMTNIHDNIWHHKATMS